MIGSAGCTDADAVVPKCNQSEFCRAPTPAPDLSHRNLNVAQTLSFFSSVGAHSSSSTMDNPNNILTMGHLYSVLELPRYATVTDLKKSFAAKARHTHPDKANNSGDEFKCLCVARNELTNPITRAIYDRLACVNCDLMPVTLMDTYSSGV